VPSYRKCGPTTSKAREASVRHAVRYAYQIESARRSAIASYVLRVKTLEANQKSPMRCSRRPMCGSKRGAWKIAHVHYSPAPGPRINSVPALQQILVYSDSAPGESSRPRAGVCPSMRGGRGDGDRAHRAAACGTSHRRLLERRRTVWRIRSNPGAMGSQVLHSVSKSTPPWRWSC